MTIAEYNSKLMSGEASARQIIEEALAAAKEIADNNAFIEILNDSALERADAIDQMLADGQRMGVLAGVPFLVKDNFLVENTTTTAASKMLENFQAPLTATAVARLEEAGAICIGKTNLDAFAHGGSTENSAFGPTKNAHDKTRVAGGSSGGSAVATALGVGAFALGTDTGGSIRQPASFNGVYGIKPSYGAVSRYGVVAMASSTDTIGVFARNIDDVEIVMATMAGRDESDMTTLPENVYTSEVKSGNTLKIGLIKETLGEGVDVQVKQATLDFADKLRTQGHEVSEVELPMMKYALGMYYIIVPAEISSNLARYDGIRYGLRSEKAKTLNEVYGLSREAGFMAENKRRIMIGSFVLSSGFFDAYYQKAQKARTLLIEEYQKLFKQYDLLISPTAPTTAFALGANTADPLQMYLADVMTVPVSLAGLPALNIPVAEDSHGLPIGVQVIANYKKDLALIDLAKEMASKDNGGAKN